MRIGALHLTIVTAKRELILRDEIRAHLLSIPVQNAIGRIARGEVKNYMSELAEAAEIPYTSPVDFMKEARNGSNRLA